MARTNGYHTHIRMYCLPLRSSELISCPGGIVRRFLERFPHRTPRPSRTRPTGYHTGRFDLPNANDA